MRGDSEERLPVDLSGGDAKKEFRKESSGRRIKYFL